MWSKHVLWNPHWTKKNLKIIGNLRKEKKEQKRNKEKLSQRSKRAQNTSF